MTLQIMKYIGGLIILSLLLPSCKENARKHSQRPDNPPIIVQPQDEDPPADPYEETEEELAAILANPENRFVFNKLKLELSTPGTIFDVSTDFKTVRVISLSTGQEAELTLSQPLFSSFNDISITGLKVNNQTIDLKSFNIYSRGDTRWLRFITQQGPHGWLVITQF